MQGVPETFRNIKTRAEAITKVNALRPLKSAVTKYPTFLDSIPDNLLSYVTEAASTEGKTKSSVSAKLIMDVLRDAVPAAAQFYILSGKFVNAARNAIMARKNELAKLKYSDFIAEGSECTDSKLIDLYNAEIRSFRDYLESHELELDYELIMQTGDVRADISVGNQAVELKIMVERMTAKKAKSLGKSSIGASHLEEVRSVLGGSWEEPFLFSFPNPERKAQGFGAVLAEDGSYRLRDRRDPERGNALLLSTALARDSQEGGRLLEKVEEYIADVENEGSPNLDILKRAAVEARAILDPTHPDAGDGAGFMAQRSNIDPLFLTFYFAFHILELSIEGFYKWQRAIYVVGRAIRGKAKLDIVLGTLTAMPGVDLMIQKLSKSTKIHSPPWVLNHSRIYDIVGTIGVCDSYFPKTTIATPGVSWRYFFNVNLDEKLINLLVTLNAIELGETASVDDIAQAERVLYQLLMGRESSLSCTISVLGNALNATINK